MCGICKLVHAAVPRQKLDYRGEIPRIMNYLHHIESEMNHYHARSTGTDLLDEERKASWRRRGLITATKHARHTSCNNAFYRAVLASHTDAARLSISHAAAKHVLCCIVKCRSAIATEPGRQLMSAIRLDRQ